MCGIAGSLGARLGPERESAALRSLDHRGPDARGTWRDGHVHLLHTRLKIIDLTENARQPMRDPATGVVIVFNGEIYNFRELRAELDEGGFFSRSDTEVILRLYLRHGLRGCVERLCGMFAFAVWDPRDESLHLARDRFGIKPLYIHEGEGGFYFASEIKALLAMGVPAGLNRSAVADYLMTGRVCHTADSFFKDIFSLPAATWLTLRDGGSERGVYWSARDIHVEEGPGTDTEEALWDIIGDALDQHMISDVPVGLCLSGGLDSQFMAHALASRGCGELHSFTFGYEDETYDEISQVEKTEYGLPLIRHSLRTSPGEILGKLDDAIAVFETPLGGLGSLSAYLLMELAREKEIPVLLSGEGADESFGGYRYYYHAYFQDLFDAGEGELLQRELAAFTAMSGEKPDPAGPFIAAGTGLRAPDGTSLGGKAFLGPALEEFSRDIPASSSGRVDGHDWLRSVMLNDLTALKLPKLLLFQDRAAMAWGVESRVPFLDHRIVEAMYRLPPRWLIRDGASKWMLKSLLRRFCNVDLADAPKTNVVTPQREWLKGPLFKAVTSRLDGGALARSGLIDYDGFRNAYGQYASSPELGNSFFVWKMINLDAMLRCFFPA